MHPSGASRRENAEWYLKLFRLFENLNRPRVQNSRRPGQASLASADPGPITTDVCCYAKLGLQRASASASISGYGSPLSRGRQVQAKRLVRRSSTSEGGSDEDSSAVGPDLRYTIAHRGISRFRVRSLGSRPRMTGIKTPHIPSRHRRL